MFHKQKRRLNKKKLYAAEPKKETHQEVEVDKLEKNTWITKRNYINDDST